MLNTGSKTFGVTVTVNSKPWRLVSSFADSGPRDRVFSAVRTPDGRSVVTFGDGVHGARPPAGGSITVGYRSGGGGQHTELSVRLQRTASDPTLDQALWVAIRNRTRAISFEFRERRKSKSRKS